MEQSQFPSFPFLCTFLLFTLMVLSLYKKHHQTVVRPPGPWKLPVIGNILQLSGGLPHHWFFSLAKVYGPIMSIQLGEIPTIVISSAKIAKEVLKTYDDHFAQRPLLLAGTLVFYDGQNLLFSPYGDQWKQMKRICTSEFFSARRVRSYRSIREEQVSSFVDFLRSKSGSLVNLTKTIGALINNIMIITSIGEKCKSQEAVLRIIEAMGEGGSGFMVADMFPSLKFLHYLSGDRARLSKLHQEGDQILEEIINDHKANRNPNSSNFLDVLLDLQKNGDLQVPLTNEIIKAIILEMFNAGSETSTKLIEWAMAELIRDSKAMSEAQEEVKRVFGEMGNVEESKIQELKYLKLVIKETLRLYPGAALTVRECKEKTKINGYDIYPKTRVFINVWAIGRDPEVWIEPDKFNPERFRNSMIDYRGKSFEYIPFGAGKRMCPAITLGITNMELILSNLLYHFDWKLPNDITLDMSERLFGTLRRNSDLQLIPIAKVK